MPEQQAKPRLNEVTLMRMILAILIVFMHSFTCYNGSWREPAGYTDIPLYKWLSRTSFAFTLEAFVFISGLPLCISANYTKAYGGGGYCIDIQQIKKTDITKYFV